MPRALWTSAWSLWSSLPQLLSFLSHWAKYKPQYLIILLIDCLVLWQELAANYKPFIKEHDRHYFDIRVFYSGFSDYGLHLYCYIHKVLADIFSGLFQVFLVELGSLKGTSNLVLYLINGVASSDCINHNWVQVLSIPVLLLPALMIETAISRRLSP